jgi:hypothetical protein
MQRFQFILFFTLLALVFAVSARSHDDDDDEDNYYPSAPYGGYSPNGQGGKNCEKRASRINTKYSTLSPRYYRLG